MINMVFSSDEKFWLSKTVRCLIEILGKYFMEQIIDGNVANFFVFSNSMLFSTILQQKIWLIYIQYIGGKVF